MKKKINAWYGWRPDRPDHRDLVFKVAKPAPLPPSVDFRGMLPPCYDQRDLGSCTGNAIAGALEFLQRKQQEKDSATPSRLFIYYNERAMEGTIGEDAGAEIRDGIKSVNKLGAPPESPSRTGGKQSCWPYKVSKFKAKPNKAAYTEALKHQTVRYERVPQSIQSLLQCLAAGYPIVFGFTCYEEFEGDEVAKTGVLELPAAHEKNVGGHAVLCVGYDQASQRFLVRNSWNTDWGQGGYFTMPFGYLTNPNLADDFWVIKEVE